jgi:hypothetical protein
VTRWASGTVMKRGQGLALKPSAVESVNTTGGGIEVGDAGTIYAEVVVTAAGTTLLVVIEGSNDQTNWFTLGQIGLSGFVVGSAAAAPTNITANGTYRACLPATQFVRYRSVVAGSFTYAVNIEAAAPY